MVFRISESEGQLPFRKHSCTCEIPIIKVIAFVSAMLVDSLGHNCSKLGLQNGI
jgi:hypothetical protein